MVVVVVDGLCAFDDALRRTLGILQQVSPAPHRVRSLLSDQDMAAAEVGSAGSEGVREDSIFSPKGWDRGMLTNRSFREKCSNNQSSAFELWRRLCFVGG